MTKKKTAKKQASASKQPKRLYRSEQNKVIAGVCGGVAEYFKIDPVIVRLIWVLLVLGYGFGVLAYLIAWLIIPKKK